jgi:uncharacterized protein
MNLKLQIVEGVFAVCRLSPSESVPAWAVAGDWWAATKTHDELSVVCSQEFVPADVTAERDWRIIKVVGPLDFALVGILSALTKPLADAGISIFAVSTFDTDYLLVKEKDFLNAVTALKSVGMEFIHE